MKSPNFLEFQQIISFLGEELVGSQLQEVYSNDDGIVLTFYRFVKDPKMVWLVIDLDTQFPHIGLYEQDPWKKTKKTKPIALFINSHFKNKYCVEIECLPEWGRIAEFKFGTEPESLKLELRLIPKQPNLIAWAYGKKLSTDKIKELVSVDQAQNVKRLLDESNKNIPERNVTSEDFADEVRSIPFIFQQWYDRRARRQTHTNINQRGPGAGSHEVREHQGAGQGVDQLSPFEKWKKQKEKDIQKKQKAISQIQEQNQKYQDVPWSDIGQYLKVYGYQNLPLEWYSYIQPDQKVSFNIQFCFDKQKQSQSKIQGGLQRIEVLKSEIAKLSVLNQDDFEKENQRLFQLQTQKSQRTLKNVEFRKMTFAEDSQILVVMGKSAQENVKLLRQAKSWDYWIHLKDYPSAYAILQRNKDKSVSDEILFKASQWLARESLRNQKNIEGLKLSVVIVECRHVRPIKGDKLGRVTYHFPREILISL